MRLIKLLATMIIFSSISVVSLAEQFIVGYPGNPSQTMSLGIEVQCTSSLGTFIYNAGTVEKMDTLTINTQDLTNCPDGTTVVINYAGYNAEGSCPATTINASQSNPVYFDIMFGGSNDKHTLLDCVSKPQ